MMKIIHLTDTHLVNKGTRLYGLDPYERLRLAIKDINQLHGDAQAAFITGDLTNWGEPAEYQAISEALMPLTVPLYLLLGNHDNRTNFKAVFPEAQLDTNGFVQSIVETSQGRMILLDTLQEGTGAGWLCKNRLDWLDIQLSEARDSIYLFMHHPPFDIGISWLDHIGLVQKAEFEAVISPYKSRIRQIFFGHVHRPINGEWLGIPFSTLRGTNHQVWLKTEHHDKNDVEFCYEQPCYGVILIDDQKTLIHTREYMYQDDIFNSRPKDLTQSQKVYATNTFKQHD
jgi:3',5'-cyclic AMP phosphodiesterase CpdA